MTFLIIRKTHYYYIERHRIMQYFLKHILCPPGISSFLAPYLAVILNYGEDDYKPNSKSHFDNNNLISDGDI